MADVLVLTSSFHIQFFHPVRTGTLRAEGRVVNRGASLVSAEAELCDGERLLARGTGTFAISAIRLDDLEAYA